MSKTESIKHTTSFINNTPENILLKGDFQEYKFISSNNQNAKRIEHTYRIGDKVIMKNFNMKNKLDPPYIGPFIIEMIHTNRILIKDSDNNKQMVNIKNIKPYWE